jgi:hypothetical protein
MKGLRHASIRGSPAARAEKQDRPWLSTKREASVYGSSHPGFQVDGDGSWLLGRWLGLVGRLFWLIFDGLLHHFLGKLGHLLLLSCGEIDEADPHPVLLL